MNHIGFVSFLKELVKICLGEALFMYVVGLLHPQNRLGSTLLQHQQKTHIICSSSLLCNEMKEVGATTGRVAARIRM